MAHTGKLLHFMPEAEIELDINRNSRTQTGYVVLENISDKTVGFKFRTNNPVDLSVVPANGILGPKEHKKAEVTYSNKRPRHGGKERLQVLVAPLDDRCLLDRDLATFFMRTGTGDLQTHRFQVRFHPTQGTSPTYQTMVSEGAPMKTVVVQTEPKEGVSPIVVEQSRSPEWNQRPGNTVLVKRLHTDRPHLVEEVAVMPSESALPVPLSNQTSRSSSGNWDLQHQRDLAAFAPPSAAHNRKAGLTSPASEEEIALGSEGHVPHYKIPMAPIVKVESEPLKEYLKRTISVLGNRLNDFADVARNLRKDQKWIFWILFLVLFLITWIVFVLPLWRRRSSYVAKEVTIADSLGTAAAEIGEVFLEDRRKMSFDEYIHWKMAH